MSEILVSQFEHIFGVSLGRLVIHQVVPKVPVMKGQVLEHAKVGELVQSKRSAVCNRDIFDGRLNVYDRVGVDEIVDLLLLFEARVPVELLVLVVEVCVKKV